MREQEQNNEMIFSKTEFTLGSGGLVMTTGLAVLPEAVSKPIELASMWPSLYLYFASEFGASRPEALAFFAAVSAVVAIDGNRRLGKIKNAEDRM